MDGQAMRRWAMVIRRSLLLFSSCAMRRQLARSAWFPWQSESRAS